jgi:hypothetical protein
MVIPIESYLSFTLALVVGEPLAGERLLRRGRHVGGRHLGILGTTLERSHLDFFISLRINFKRILLRF